MLWRLKGGIGHEGGPANSLEEIAERLNASEPTPPRPGARDQPWTASAVRNALRTARNQRLVLLRRMGSLLAAVDEHQPIRSHELTGLGRRHQLDVYWIWDRFQLGDVIDIDVERGAPAGAPVEIDRQQATVVITDLGRNILDRYRKLLAIPVELHEAAHKLWWNDGQMPRAAVPRTGRFYGASLDELVGMGLAEERPGRLMAATKLGLRIDQDWGVTANLDEQGRWDREFRPDAEELRNLPPHWDWDDRPVLPPGPRPG